MYELWYLARYNSWQVCAVQTRLPHCFLQRSYNFLRCRMVNVSQAISSCGGPYPESRTEIAQDLAKLGFTGNGDWYVSACAQA